VNLNDLERNQLLLDSAAKLAQDFDAHLQGLYVIPTIEVYGGMGMVGAPIIFEGNRELFKNAEKSVRAMFDSVVKAAGIRSDIEVIDSKSPSITGHMIDRATTIRNRVSAISSGHATTSRSCGDCSKRAASTRRTSQY